MARSLASHFGGFLDWDRRRDDGCLRIRVWVKIDVPLRKGQLLAAGGGKAPYKPVFKYDKLYDFFFRCGFIDHQERECTMVVVPGQQGPRFGAWLRAQTRIPGGNDGMERGGGRQGNPIAGQQNNKNEKGKAVAPEDNFELDEYEEEDEGLAEDEVTDEQETSKFSSMNDINEEFEFDVGGQYVKNTARDQRGIKIGSDKEQGSETINQKKRANVTSSAFGTGSSGISPPLKKMNTDDGLGLAAAAEQPCPPQ